ncbi:hypothetical protein H5U35_06490 [Candidatus Aerophobetes bacterium]|nr:hypothetical protein [Candidatus Aerophobetes bacterium]
MGKGKIILIDANALLYRSFYALPPLKTKEGFPTGGIYGFCRILMKLLKEEKPDYIACAFDKGKKTFRHEESKEYKATRPKTPPQLSEQIPILKEVLKGFNISFFEKDEYEADDILATIARKAEKKGLEVKIFTADKDILQIASDSVKIVQFKKGVSKTQTFDHHKVKEEYGIYPQQIPDYLCLVGDTSDNIPGVEGIGPKTASSLIQRFGSLENLLSSLDRLPSPVAQKIRENAEKVKLSKRLATVVTEVPLDIDLETLRVKDPDLEKLLPVFEKLEFKKLEDKVREEYINKGPSSTGSKENLLFPLD